MSGSQEKSESPPAITRLRVQGFKSLRDEVDIEIRPLTILAGANNSGKSSVMQPLLLLKQTLDAPYDSVLRLDGDHLHFDDTRQLYWRHDTGSASAFFAVDVITTSGVAALRFGRGVDGALTMVGAGRVLRVDRVSNGGGEETTDGDVATSSRDYTSSAELTDVIATELRAQLAHREIVSSSGRSTLRDRLISRDSRSALTTLAPTLLPMIHIRAVRDRAARSYQKSILSGHFRGPFDPYVASLLAEWEYEDPSRLAQVNRALWRLRLTGGVRAELVNGASYKIFVGRTVWDPDALRATGSVDPMRDIVEIADVGTGISQVLPVLVGLVAAEKNQLMYVEEPEANLHPRAQAVLARLIMEAVGRGARVVLETHSSLLLLAIQTLVAEDKSRSDLVKLHWFWRDTDGATHSKSGELDEHGAFGDWPVDFGDVELKQQDAFLTASLAE